MAAIGIDIENKATYSPSFPRLENMAALSAAVDVWNCYFSHHDELEDCKDELNEVNEIINNMKIPNCIRKKVTALSETIKNEMFESNTDILRGMCHTCGSRYHFFLYGAVWDMNGHIDDKKTAEKVLQCPERSNDNDDMFKVITLYCLENRIMDFPKFSLSDKFLSTYLSDHMHELTAYWFACRRHEENTLDGWYYEHLLQIVQIRQRRLLDRIKLAIIPNLPMCAYEYFWGFLDENEQMTMTKNLIRRDKKYQMVLFSKMSRYQLSCLYLEEPVVIITNYFCLRELELVMATWERIKLTINEEQFESLINVILDSEMYREDNSSLRCLIDLWSSAPDNLIDYLINVKNCAIAAKFFLINSKSRVSCFNFNFLKVVLLRATLEFRKQFLLENGLHFLWNYSYGFFRSFIEHCLDVSDQLEITEILLVTAMESESTKILRCFRDLLYCSGEEFYAFLKFLTLDQDLQMRVKKRLLRSGELVIRKLIRIDNWAKLFKFIDQLYPKDEKEARRQKKKTFNLFLRSHFHYWNCFRRNGDEKFAEIDNLLAQFFTPKEIVTFKENIMDEFQTTCSDTRRFSDIVLKRVNVPKLTAWCYNGDEEKISQFKRSFPIDTAFQVFLHEAVERYTNERDTDLSFSSLEQLLWWKFASKKCIKSFKRSQILGVMRTSNVRTYLTRDRWMSDVLKKILAWIFDGNEFQVEKFKRLYQKDRWKIIYWLKTCARSNMTYYHSSDESD